MRRSLADRASRGSLRQAPVASGFGAHGFLAAALGLLLAGAPLGCTLSPGAPWATVEEAVLEVRFAPPILEDGRVEASSEHALVLEDVRLTVESAALFVTAPEPRDDGHGHDHGHAHEHEHEHEAEHEREDDGAALVLPGGMLDLALGDAPRALSLARCEESCWLPRGELTELVLTLASFEARGRVYDRRADARLPDEGAPFLARVDGPVRVHAPLSVPVASEGGVETAHLFLEAQLTLPERPFAAVDFASLPSEDGALVLDAPSAEGVLAALSTSTLSAHLEHEHGAHDHDEHEHDHDDEHDHDHEEDEG